MLNNHYLVIQVTSASSSVACKEATSKDASNTKVDQVSSSDQNEQGMNLGDELQNFVGGTDIKVLGYFISLLPFTI